MSAGLRRLAVLAAAACAGLLPLGAAGQEAAGRSLTLVVPFPAGSGTDAAARVLGEALRRRTGQTIVVENRAGADGTLAARAVVAAQPDGATLLVGGNSTHSAAANLFNALPYDPLRDLAPVAGLVKIPLLLAARPDLPARDLPALLRLARQPGARLTLGHSNTSSRVGGELFRARAGLDLSLVPYRGSPQALTDLIGGRLDLFFVDPAAAGSMVESGQVRALAVSSAARLPQFPDVPTVAEGASLPGFEMVAWIAVFAPAGTPAVTVERIGREMTASLADPEWTAFLTRFGGEAFVVSPAELGAFAERDIGKWADVVRAAGMEKR